MKEWASTHKLGRRKSRAWGRRSGLCAFCCGGRGNTLETRLDKYNRTELEFGHKDSENISKFQLTWSKGHLLYPPNLPLSSQVLPAWVEGTSCLSQKLRSQS